MSRWMSFGIVTAVALIGGAIARAQEPPCGLRNITETTPPIYPPIARAAHVSGLVIVLVSFDLSGNVSEAHAVSGAKLLQAPAVTFVRGWKANEYGGSRSCAVAVEYALAAGVYCSSDDPKISGEVPPSGRRDSLHYLVSSYAMALCDPAATIGKRRRRFGIF